MNTSRWHLARVILWICKQSNRGLSRSLTALAAVCLAAAMLPATLHAQIYTDLHDFDCTVEGCSPTYPELLAQGRDGNLYGTTNAGGTSGMGTVFKMTPSGTITTIYNFSGTDGWNPSGGLVLGTDGNFYGTTNIGGTNNQGTVFKITPAGALTTLYNFTAGADGANPIGGVVLGKNGSFYGATCGFNPPWTLYSITATGKFKVINRAYPACSYSGLTLGIDGNLYGESSAGGTTGRGAPFRATAAGAVKILYNFDYTHGAYPFSPVVQGNDGLIYGTTSAGGSTGAGTVFKLTTSGKITLLHVFNPGGGADGDLPFAGLAFANDGNFYGAAEGANSGLYPDGDLFSVTSAGSYSPLYAFDAVHGTLPEATPMQHTNGKIYGLTERGGGPGGLGSGVAYSLDMGLKPFVSTVTFWGSAGTTVEILGQGLNTVTSVKFGSGAASFTVVSDTYITAVVPDDGTTGFVTVTSSSGTLTSNRRFNVVPVISSISPSSGPVGTQVTITGAGFVGATQVTFGGVKATSFSADPSGTSITATVPAGAVSGKITVKTPGGSALSKTTFTVT